MRHVYITNGTGGCGKDTFANFMKALVYRTDKISSIDPIKTIAKECGWTGGKTEKDRKLLSDLKCLLSGYNDLPFKYLQAWMEIIPDDEYVRVVLIDIREPEEIARAVKEFGAKTILIRNDRVPPIQSNMADANVFKYEYDFVIDNNGTLKDFEEAVKSFAEKEGLINVCQETR